MKRIFKNFHLTTLGVLALVSLLLLSGCGSKSTDQTNGSLGSMFDSNTDDSGSGDVLSPDEVPSSVGPSEIPSDLVPNE
jgi:hypothetical protein